MPWVNPIIKTCVDCGIEFEAWTYNVQRCHEHRAKHNLQRRQERYYAKRGEPSDRKSSSSPGMARLNQYIAQRAYTTTCPNCGRHMCKCECCASHMKVMVIPRVQTWQPWKMDVERVAVRGKTWKPWEVQS